ncbi:hypothetical protein POSPLADRAFT_1034858 [Postia placenta MAD-698-R-SB12]|uniref:NADH dehydrogenase [ubiquinone] 1 alpha subcomplex assembly factor 3 n=1 Tax=Postia placenta MAD-698-R-SB12 TaxID=670580 RepID=A0A1X6MVE2_9APHY|nr:hypothetical protein POSPLADRAFT_1034858 [Postia placenta MAD-698-R-SB12]OSX60202.1 hypothetical protein POSPLADRAFT_1034858 [Postia placenta MAD-698-R-SB12]
MNMLVRSATRALSLRTSGQRFLHASPYRLNQAGGFTNMLEGGPAPAVQVKTITPDGIQLADGLVIPSACIFLDGKVFLWDVPEKQWEGWDKKHFEIFEMVVPKPGETWTLLLLHNVSNYSLPPVEILLLGTGKTVSFVPPALRQYLNQTGIQVDVMSTWNACSTYNLLTEEGRRVAAALLPLTARSWSRVSE